ncbi:hypothetical protein [Paractinoplanes durhamensis]|uniref:hypothetical protein n=1 Tax=Paractinoplanes durhamensis TaxID=113563 RepID=UPI003630EE1E
MASTRTVVRATGRALASLALIVAGLYLAWRGFLLLHAQLATAHAKPVWGGLGLCAAAVVAVAWGLRMYLPRPRLPLLLGSAVAIDAGLTVLGGAWLVHDQAVAGAIAGGVAAVVPALFLLGLMVFLGDWELYEDDTWQMGIAAAVLAEATAIAVAVTAAVGGHPAPAWIFGSVAALPVAAWLAYALFRMVASALRVSGRRTPPPLTTQLAGLLVPAGAIVAAGIVQTGNPCTATSAACSARSAPGPSCWSRRSPCNGWCSTGSPSTSPPNPATNRPAATTAAGPRSRTRSAGSSRRSAAGTCGPPTTTPCAGSRTGCATWNANP